MLTRIVVFVFCLCLCLTPALAQDGIAPPSTIPTRPPAALTLQGEGFQVEQYFSTLTQGQVGLLRLIGDDISEAHALLRNRAYDFHQAEDGWYALIVADIDAQPRAYTLAVVVQRGDGQVATLETQITIESAGYIRQSFPVPADRAFLTEPEVERYEFARLDVYTEPQTPERLWDEGLFRAPIDSEINSAFGLYRILNQNSITRHTGWDQRAPVGTPVTAMADGVVAFAGQLDIRGNYVLIDHGWGVYTGYAHFSQFNVERGMRVEQGAIIGLSGNTGRSNGPHLHWEIRVQGEWIDGLAFIQTWLPSD
jgi:murein DD-endopeptidase MepM/ murein hydrolase activator NlpD